MHPTTIIKAFEEQRARPASAKAFISEALASGMGAKEAQAVWSHPAGRSLEKLCAQIDELQGSSQPAYHDAQHFLEAAYSMALMCSKEFDDCPDRARLVAIGVFSMAGHDMLHDGTTNAPGREKSLEHISLEAVEPLMQGWEQGDKELARQAILGTDPTLMGKNRQEYLANPSDAMARMKLLANEADLCASMLPGCGQKLGDILREEWTASGSPMADSVATWKARRGFLSAIPMASKASQAIGIEGARIAQVEAFDALGAEFGSSAAAAAEKLDSIAASSPQQALGAYARQLAKQHPQLAQAAFGALAAEPSIGALKRKPEAPTPGIGQKNAFSI